MYKIPTRPTGASRRIGDKEEVIGQKKDSSSKGIASSPDSGERRAIRGKNMGSGTAGTKAAGRGKGKGAAVLKASV